MNGENGNLLIGFLSPGRRGLADRRLVRINKWNGAIREMLALIIGEVYDDEKRKVLLKKSKMDTPCPAIPMT
jgi:hypothetical protein